MFYFKKYYNYIRRTCGYRPSIAIEPRLFNRVKKSKYGRYLMPKPLVEKSQFDIYLRRATTTLSRPVQIRVNMRDLSKAAVRVLGYLKFKTLKPTSLKFASTLLNMSASSGFPFIGRKGANLEKIRKMAKVMSEKRLTGNFKYFPNLCAFRLQQRGKFPKFSMKTRVMYPYPGAITLLEQQFLFPVITNFAKQKGNTFYTLGMTGGDMTNWLKNRKSFDPKKKKIVSVDLSAFDQNTCNELSASAFWVVKRLFKLTKEQTELFCNLMLHTLCSYHAMRYKSKPHMFIKDHGIPSGSSFTNLIGTIVHAIIMEYANPGILSEGNTLLCSDDNITLMTTEEEKRLYETYSAFGYTVQPEKSDVFKSWRKVSFLGYDWIDFLRNINLPLGVNQMVYHSQFLVELDAYERELARSASILLTGVNGQYAFRQLFPEVVSDIERGKDVRYMYLHGYSNPVTNPSVINKVSPKMRNTVSLSLKEHLTLGHFIR